MINLKTLKSKLLSLAIAGGTVCFSHGGCSSYNDGVFYDTVDYFQGWYDETVYYFEDDYYYYDDCARCDGYGWDSWFNWF